MPTNVEMQRCRVIARYPTEQPNIYCLLDSIKKRPGFYLRSPTLGSLKDFLTGFSVGQFPGSHENDDERPFSDFSAWFCHHLNISCAGAGGWYGAIMHESGIERKGFDRFFEYLAMYREKAPVLRYHFALTATQRKYYGTSNRDLAPYKLRLTRYRGERCLFLHARYGQHGDWRIHTVFSSLTKSRPWMTKVFGITDTHWKKAMRPQ